MINRMKHIGIIILSLILAFDLIAQKENDINDFKYELNETKHDTSRIKLFNQIAQYYRNRNTDSTLVFCDIVVKSTDSILLNSKARNLIEVLEKQKAISLTIAGHVFIERGQYKKAENNYLNAYDIYKLYEDKLGMGKCFNNLGRVYNNTESKDKSIEFYSKALQIFLEIGFERGILACYINIAVLHKNSGQFIESLDLLFKALKLINDTGKNQGLITLCYNNIGTVFFEQKEYDNSLIYTKKALKLRKETDDLKGVASCYINIGIIHEARANYDSALHFYNEALKIRRDIKYTIGLAECYNNIAVVNKKQGEFKSAIENYQKAEKYYRNQGRKSGHAIVLGNISSLYNKMAETVCDKKEITFLLNNSVKYGEKALQIANEIESFQIEYEFSLNIMDALKNLNNPKEALKYAEIYIESRDSMFTIEKSKARSEEHTSELQSHSFISYAVFCLKKKKY